MAAELMLIGSAISPPLEQIYAVVFVIPGVSPALSGEKLYVMV